MIDEQNRLEPSGPQKRRFWVIFVLLYLGWGLVLAYACSDGRSHRLLLVVGVTTIVMVAMRLSAWAVSILPSREMAKGRRADLPSRVQ